MPYLCTCYRNDVYVMYNEDKALLKEVEAIVAGVVRCSDCSADNNYR